MRLLRINTETQAGNIKFAVDALLHEIQMLRAENEKLRARQQRIWDAAREGMEMSTVGESWTTLEAALAQIAKEDL